MSVLLSQLYCIACHYCVEIVVTFARDESDAIQEVESMPGTFRYGVDKLKSAVWPLVEKGLKSVLLFGVPGEGKKVRKMSTAFSVHFLTVYVPVFQDHSRHNTVIRLIHVNLALKRVIAFDIVFIRLVFDRHLYPQHSSRTIADLRLMTQLDQRYKLLSDFASGSLHCWWRATSVFVRTRRTDIAVCGFGSVLHSSSKQKDVCGCLSVLTYHCVDLL